MKKLKLAFWIIVIGFFGLVVYQNQDFFLSQHSLGIDVQFAAYRTPSLPNAVLFVAFFLLGWLIAYAFGLMERYKHTRTVKSMRNTVHSQQDAISLLKKDVESLKADAADSQPDPLVSTESPTAPPEPALSNQD
jgi:hypothetical protein